MSKIYQAAGGAPPGAGGFPGAEGFPGGAPGGAGGFPGAPGGGQSSGPQVDEVD